MKVDSLGQQRITTHLPAHPGAGSFGLDDASSVTTVTNKPGLKTVKGSRLPRFKKNNNDLSNIIVGGLVKKEETLDVFRLQAFSGLQLLRLAFDPAEVTQTIRSEFKSLLMLVRYPKLLNLGFNPVTCPSSGSGLPTGAQLCASFETDPGDLQQELSHIILSTSNFSTTLAPKMNKQASLRVAKDRLSATMKNVIGSGNGASQHQVLVSCKSDQSVSTAICHELRNLASFHTRDAAFRPLSTQDIDFLREAIQVRFSSTRGIAHNKALLDHFLVQPAFFDLAKMTFESGPHEQKRTASCTSLELKRCFADNSDYTLCRTYPPMVVVPPGFNEQHLIKVAKNFALGRFPVVVWRHPTNKAFLFRGSGFCAKNIISQIKSTASQATNQSWSLTIDPLPVD
ncbi:hypothetical protein Ciccas_002414 [Cichlidogyrus casuarinus]|uniref:Myotubularin phosphatase domain-containing protein n=1 Tax=Cichlidogyrus casuarinus TaxID=1844966 RepID=A0ABD2QIA1_9PLAT